MAPQAAARYRAPMDAVIFDFDGVVVDSERYWDDMDRAFFQELVPSWTIADGDRMSGLGTEAGYELLRKDYGVTLPYADYFRRLDDAVQTVVYGEKIRLLPGIPELLALLRERRTPIAIASSAHRSWIDAALTRLDLRGIFPVICSNDDVGARTKPLPDVYLLAAKRLGVDPARCLALEDSRNGVRAAKAAGMTCYAIRTDMNPRQDLTEADRVITNCAEVEALV